ncbi:hypothetical protein TD95_004597 [Thielaviopsis punctulata]|uniref:Thiamine phosphate synthase/TenI domain-containing protein n=1 Tax=Thielaviopsis punctulata TaxID=72032 RepID=A0A0F4ZD43_9PEZI|nr:hypothetical protein TD95_004597 [Thielaviopsis punctulata]
MKLEADYSLYLVTDSTPALLGSRYLPDVVHAAIDGGVTLVQYRIKNADTAAMIAEARALHAVTRARGVPLLINDRVDVALAVGCEGVHVGQDDMGVAEARRLLGPDKIVGVTAASVEEALRGCADGADYLGIGTVFSTSTKTNTKHIIGTAGVKAILSALAASPYAAVKTVCIGGLTTANIPRVLYQSASPHKSLDGIALVSAIISAPDPRTAASELLHLVKMPPAFMRQTLPGPLVVAANEMVRFAPSVVRLVHETRPLSHNMTNLVVQNFAANVALAVGASPIMASYGREAEDLAKLGGALVVNMGTVTPEGLENYKQAVQAYNQAGQPIVLDPVGAGATHIRRNAVNELLAAGYYDVIKGNEGEIQTVWNTQRIPQQRGVDSASLLTLLQRASLVCSLARRERNVILMTGAVDVVSDGTRTYAVRNGHPFLGDVTGTGCVLGTAVSAALAAYPQDKLAACVAAMLLYEVAAEMAAERQDVQGPGTFAVAFIDELYKLRMATAAGDLRWLVIAKLEEIQVTEDFAE